MRCKDLDRRLEDWLDGKADPELVVHLGECVSCRSLAEELRRQAPLLAGLRQQPPELGAAFWLRLRERMAEADQRQEAFWAAFNLLAARAAAVLAAMLLALTLLTFRQPRPSSLTDIELPQEASVLANGDMTRDQILLSLAETEPRQ